MLVGSTIVAALLALGAFGPGGARGPSLDDFKSELRKAAGPEALDCGFISLREPAKAAVSCAQDALVQGRSFHVAFQVMGVDSTIYEALARRSGETPLAMTWDSDIYGGASSREMRRISKRPCATPTLRLADRGGILVECGDASHP